MVAERLPVEVEPDVAPPVANPVPVQEVVFIELQVSKDEPP